MVRAVKASWIAAVLLLTACGGNGATPTNNVAAAGMPGNSDVAATPLDDRVDNAARAAIGNAAAVAKRFDYDCRPGMTLAVRYDNDATPDGQALVTLDGKDYTLDHVISGSGARYLTRNGRTPGASLVWWNKGRGGMLLEGKADDPAADEKTLATCSEKG